MGDRPVVFQPIGLLASTRQRWLHRGSSGPIPRIDLARGTLVAARHTGRRHPRLGHAGGTTALLIEVKLSEPDFDGCSAWLTPANDPLDVCEATGPFGNDTSACFQLRSQGREHRRHYDTALGPLIASTATAGGRCGSGSAETSRCATPLSLAHS